ncbi:MAG: gluconeogenesis factor YvcK family protein [Dehalococcoidia bacterium]
MSRLWNADFLKWLYPGMHIKRWLALLMLAVVIMALGIAYFLREAYVSYTFPSFIYYLTLQFIPRFGRGIIFVVVSVGLIVFALWHLNSSLLSAVLPRRQNSSLVNIIWGQRYLRRGPKIVAIGGGTGLSILLRGLKQHTGNLIAIVTVADDGGSSGRLRRELGILPPGDVRNCIAALADAEPLMTKLFQYRFADGSDLAGHSFGNLFIVAMSGVLGNFEEAIKQTSRVLAVRGQIVPSTLVDVTLEAKTENEETIQGEANITESASRIKEVYLQPSNAQACPEAIRAILEADVIVVGPGSLFTSVLPNLLVDGIRRAMKASSALKLYVCNVATQPGETDGFNVADHVRALERHVGKGLFHFVLANSNIKDGLPETWRSQPVRIEDGDALRGHLILADVVSEENRYYHDSKKLGEAVLRLYYARNHLNQTLAVEEEAVEDKVASALD